MSCQGKKIKDLNQSFQTNKYADKGPEAKYKQRRDNNKFTKRIKTNH